MTQQMTLPRLKECLAVSSAGLGRNSSAGLERNSRAGHERKSGERYELMRIKATLHEVTDSSHSFKGTANTGYYHRP